MHELSITEGLLKLCLKEAEKHNIKKIIKLNIKVGELTEIVPKCIEYYFRLLAKGTIAEDANIFVESIHVNIRCDNCEYMGVLPKNTYKCPNCDGRKYIITKGNGFYLDSIEVEE